jgi:peptidoglycan-associated lipoprotein
VSVGCGSDPKPKTAVDARPHNEAKAPPPLPETTAQRPTATRDEAPSVGVMVDEAIVKACGIPAAEAHFEFDSSNVQMEDVPALNKVATCLASGALKGRSVSIVGRADPRGESDYNVALGQRRADSIGHYLGDHGLADGQRSQSSRGAMDATGTDEAGWARDRRVDLVLMR